jgi:hypothetical protein
MGSGSVMPLLLIAYALSKISAQVGRSAGDYYKHNRTIALSSFE